MEETMTPTTNAPAKFSKAYLKRTIWIGLAFFGILLVWQLYNGYCSPMLSFLFARNEYADKVALAEQAYNLMKAAYDANPSVAPNPGSFDMKFILANNFITADEYLSIQWKVGIIMALDNIAALFIMPIFGNLSDKTKTKLGKRMPYIIVGSVVTAIALPFIPVFFSKGMGNEGTALVGCIVGMITTMCIIIVFMMSYRSPAVALMPDLTPKPLRSKANGIINVVGYVGGAIGSVFAIVISVTNYLDSSAKSLWTLEIPFIACSVVLLISLVILLLKVNENKLHEELDEEIRQGDSKGESAEQVTNSGKLSKVNIRNLAIILVAEMFWFMSLNAIETFQTNYLMFWENCSSSGGAIMTVLSGAASVVGFLLAGKIADKIGRKWTIFIGICVVTLCYVIYSFAPQSETVANGGAYTFNESMWFVFWILLPIIGFATSLIHICSFPLVTDYCTAEKLGKFTSLYYTASMLAQSVTPICIGLIFQATSWQALPIYSAILMGCAGVVFFFVKAPRANDKAQNAKGLEALGADD